MKPLTASLAALLMLSACAGSDSRLAKRYVAEREALIDGLEVMIVEGCVSYEARTGMDGCADGRIDLNRFGGALPPEMLSAKEGYCGLMNAGGPYAAVGRAAIVLAVNRHLRRRGVPVFASSICLA